MSTGKVELDPSTKESFMATATAQSIFDYVVTKLADQGKRSSGMLSASIGPICLYRGPGGLKCAVGWLIPDTVYEPNMEGLCVDNLCNWSPMALSHLRPWTGLLEDLQHCHDESRNDGILRIGLSTVATQYGLSDQKVGLITTWSYT